MVISFLAVNNMVLLIYPLFLFALLCDSLAMHEESSTRRQVEDDVHEGAVPAYLLDRDSTTRAKACFFIIDLLFLLKLFLRLVPDFHLSSLLLGS